MASQLDLESALGGHCMFTGILLSAYSEIFVGSTLCRFFEIYWLNQGSSMVHVLAGHGGTRPAQSTLTPHSKSRQYFDCCEHG